MSPCPFLVGLILSALSVGCVTPGRLSSFRFPERFATLQVVHMEMAHQSFDLLAMLERAEGRFVLVLLDAILQRPLLRVEAMGNDIRETRLAPLELDSQAVSALMRGIVRMYEADDFLSDGPELVGAGAGVSYRLANWQGDAACRWPGVIEWRLNQRVPLAIRVESREWSCGIPPASP